MPLGDSALLIRFGERLSDAGNRAAIALAKRIEAETIAGVVEVVPNLISVLVRYNPKVIEFDRLAGEISLFTALPVTDKGEVRIHRLAVRFDGEDLPEVASSLQLSPVDFIAAHNSGLLRVLATGFAPGFVYCGFHPENLQVPRREQVRRQVPAGTVLFAAGQTAITATPIPTGWHVIGHTGFRNFDAEAHRPATLAAGDLVTFEVAQ